MMKAFLAATALATLAAPALAATITFDDIVTTGNNIFASTVSGGFTFAGQHFHIVDSPAAFGGVANGTQYLAAEAAGGLGKPVNFSKVGGGVFSLNGADIAELWLPGNANNDFLTVVFTGTVSGGGTLTQTFTLDGLRDGAGGIADFQTVSFTGWNNLTSVNVTGRNAQGAFGDYSIDNLVVNAVTGAVPEASTWMMMIAGLGIAGAAMRRRRLGAVGLA